MITTERISAFLRQHWDRLGNGEPEPPSFSFVVITKGKEPVGKIVLLAFPGQQTVPRFAIKLARLKEQNRALEDEHRNLSIVAPYGSYGSVLTPKSLLCGEETGHLLLIESVIEGIDLSQAASRSRSVTFVAPIVDWLIHLGRATVGLAPQGKSTEDFSELVECAARHAATEQERQVLTQVSGRLLALDGKRLPRVFEQRDMGTWNLMVSREGRIGVLDWESSRPYGFPAWDLFYFLAHYGFMVHEAKTLADRLESFGDTFFNLSGFGRTAVSSVRRYTDALRLCPEWLGPLFLGCWLHHTLSEVSRLDIRLSDSLFWRMLTLTLERDCRLNFLEWP